MKLTVITVSYNTQDTIARTLSSVAMQRLHDDTGDYIAQYSQGRKYEVEHWVVDGASTDATLDMVRLYEYVQWHSEPDSGLYDAMNKGIRLATGDYLVFLNAGDTLHDAYTLQHVFDCAKPSASSAERDAKASLPAIIYGQTQVVDDEGQFIDMRHYWAPDKLCSASFRRGMLVCHQSFYVRTDLARQEAYDLSYRFSADYDWCIRLMRRAEREQLAMVNTNYILTSYLQDGITTANHAASLHERLHIMAKHYGWLRALWQHAKIVGRKFLSF